MSPSHNDSPATARDVWTVSRLNLEVRAVLESGFGPVWVEGELSNFAHPRSGHMYFSLKDSSCQVRCAMFRGQNRHLKFAPESGQQVMLRGRIGLYAERGEYQLVVDYMEEGGIGALQRAFESLKSKLGAEGLFDAENKRPLPAMPRQVGILSSPTGAAVHDILTTLRRRFPDLPVIIYPVPVQGADAPGAIAAMLQTAAARDECDVLIVARGGGSLEDLWAFNEESTARAIAACPIPIVSGVGHEVDFTIADFVADHRAATPTAAAESVSPDGEALKLKIAGLAHRLTRVTRERLRHETQQLRHLRARLVHPATRLQELSQRADRLTDQLSYLMHERISDAQLRLSRLLQTLAQHHPRRRLDNLTLRHQQAKLRLSIAATRLVTDRRLKLASAERALRAVGPEATLARGYAIVTDAHAQVVRDSASVTAGDNIHVRLAAGAVDATVTGTKSGERASESPDQ